MKTIKQVLKMGIAATLALMMVACGGGGDSSSGGGSSASFAGNYKGTQTFVLTQGVKVFPAQTETLSVTINAGGEVQYIVEGVLLGVGRINGSAIAIDIDAGTLFNQPGTTCTGTIILRGNVSAAGVITGSIGSTGVACNGVAMSFKGNFRATKL